MAIKTREPGDAFKRQVAEYVPVKKRRPWRDEEEALEGEAGEKPKAEESKRDVQGATSSKAEFARDELSADQTPTQAKIARDGGLKIEFSSRANSALDENVKLKVSTSADSALVEESKEESPVISTQVKSTRVETFDQSSKEAQVTPQKIGNIEESYVSSRVDFARDEKSLGLEERVSSRAKIALDETVEIIPSTQAKSALVQDSKLRGPSRAKSALDEDQNVVIPTQANFALDEGRKPGFSSRAKSALVENHIDRERPNYQRYVRQQFRSISVKETEAQTEVLEPLAGTRKSRGTFVFEVAVKRIDNPSAALLYCYLWHQAEEMGSAQLKISIGEMSEAINVARRTVTDAVRRLSELGLFENVNNGKTTVPVVRLKFGLS